MPYINHPDVWVIGIRPKWVDNIIKENLYWTGQDFSTNRNNAMIFDDYFDVKSFLENPENTSQFKNAGLIAIRKKV